MQINALRTIIDDTKIITINKEQNNLKNDTLGKFIILILLDRMKINYDFRIGFKKVIKALSSEISNRKSTNTVTS